MPNRCKWCILMPDIMAKVDVLDMLISVWTVANDNRTAVTQQVRKVHWTGVKATSPFSFPFSKWISFYFLDFLQDPNLCSHIWAVCYLSQSIYDSSLMNAEPCTRRCPVGLRNLRNNRFQFRQTLGFGIPMGQHTPMKYVLRNSRPIIFPQSNLIFSLRWFVVRMDLIVWKTIRRHTVRPALNHW